MTELASLACLQNLTEEADLLRRALKVVLGDHEPNRCREIRGGLGRRHCLGGARDVANAEDAEACERLAERQHLVLAQARQVLRGAQILVLAVQVRESAALLGEASGVGAARAARVQHDAAEQQLLVLRKRGEQRHDLRRRVLGTSRYEASAMVDDVSVVGGAPST